MGLSRGRRQHILRPALPGKGPDIIGQSRLCSPARSSLIHSQAFYRSLVRPLLFTLPPERAQSVADLALRYPRPWKALAGMFEVRDDRLAVELAGMKLANPVGLAAGYDKNCEVLPALASLGFGYVSCGTVVALPQPGNPQPRVLRDKNRESLINSLGFPSKGLDYAVERLQPGGRPSSVPVIGSVSGVILDDVLRCHRGIEALVDAVELNISSPNTSGLRVFQEPPALSELLGRLNEDRKRPLLVKLPPYDVGGELSERRERVMALADVCVRRGVDGLTVANTHPMEDARLAVGKGGLSGRAIFERTVAMVADVRAEIGGSAAINASGGIFTGEDAWRAIKAGATTVQLLTGFVYRGPGIARAISRELLTEMDREGVASLASVRRQ